VINCVRPGTRLRSVARDPTPVGPSVSRLLLTMFDCHSRESKSDSQGVARLFLGGRYGDSQVGERPRQTSARVSQSLDAAGGGL